MNRSKRPDDLHHDNNQHPVADGISRTLASGGFDNEEIAYFIATLSVGVSRDDLPPALAHTLNAALKTVGIETNDDRAPSQEEITAALVRRKPPTDLFRAVDRFRRRHLPVLVREEKQRQANALLGHRAHPTAEMLPAQPPEAPAGTSTVDSLINERQPRRIYR